VDASEMSVTPGGKLPWCVYDRRANLLHVAACFQDAEARAFSYWDVVEVGDREEIADHDYWYLATRLEPTLKNKTPG
jgi:hypothetical protein